MGALSPLPTSFLAWGPSARPDGAAGGNPGCVHAHACAPLCTATSAEGSRFRAPVHLKPTRTHPDAHGQSQDRMGAQGPLQQIPILPVAMGEPEDRA